MTKKKPINTEDAESFQRHAREILKDYEPEDVQRLLDDLYEMFPNGRFEMEGWGRKVINEEKVKALGFRWGRHG